MTLQNKIMDDLLSTPAFNPITPIKDVKSVQREVKKTKPIYIKKLIEKIGNHNKVGEIIGMSGGAISKIIQADETCIANELAALFMWKQLNPETPVKKVTAVIRFEDKHLFSIDTMMKSLGVKVIILGTMED